jgi:hypothetical protein
LDKSHKYLILKDHGVIIREIMKSCTGTLRGYFLINPAQSYGSVEHHTTAVPSDHIKELEESHNFKSIAFVRNPFSRLVSCYLQKIYYYHDPNRPGGIGINHHRLNKHSSFKDFINLVCSTPDNEADCHFRSMHVSIPENCTVGRAENFEKDFYSFLKSNGINQHPIERRNTTFDKKDSKHYTEYYTPELIKMVSERYKEDLERFGYKFD